MVDAHVDRDVAVGLDAHGAGAAARGDGELVPALEAGVDEVAGEDARAVAAHLGGAAVAVAVVHEPARVAGLVGDLGRHGGRHDAQDAVGAEPEAAVGERAHLRGVEARRGVGVGHEHEVVARAVPLEHARAPRAASAAASVVARRPCRGHAAQPSRAACGARAEVAARVTARIVATRRLMRRLGSHSRPDAGGVVRGGRSVGGSA